MSGAAAAEEPAGAPLDRLDDAAFLAGFEAGTLPPDGFRHPEHVRAAWLLLRRDGPAEALVRYPAALRRLAAAAGKPDLYHETVTWTWLLLIHERMARGMPDGSEMRCHDARTAGTSEPGCSVDSRAGWGGDHGSGPADPGEPGKLDDRGGEGGAESGGTTWEGFRRTNPDLFERGGATLRRYYREETLRSEVARRVFVLPDLLATPTP